ncbi:UNVERIFIED_ORG: glycosyltransferase involved in cell wall biosynthesis [Comamonas terrigena]
MQGKLEGQKTAWIISYTPVAKEPRLIRQANALEEAGWKVVVFGLPASDPSPPSWHFVELIDSIPSQYARAVMRLVRIGGAALARFGVLQPVRLMGARLTQWATLFYRARRKTIVQFLEKHPEHRPDLVLCHDYFTADVALMIGGKADAPVSVDCHEYALGQYAHDARWLRWQRPVVKALQDDMYARVDGITTVCEGIAELIAADHDLLRPACVVRSVPFFVQQPFRPTGETITVIYHGEIFPTRMLHVAVRSMRLWRPEFRLVFRGYSDPAYVEQLWEIAREAGVADRLTIEPPVPFKQIIPSANQADVGYFVHLDTSPQRRFALPNKFFEYVMAGLALAVSDLPEMARIVRQHELGALVPECDEESIAHAINALDRPKIDCMKQASLKAARDLNWEKEREKMLALYEEVLA